MKIKSLRLQRFRQFEDTTIDFGDFNLLVGPNNSGKTTVLHAIRAFFLLMQGHLRFEGDPPRAAYHRRYLTGTDEVAPTPDIRELWHRQQAGKPLVISVTFDDAQVFHMSLKQQFGQIHVSSDDLPSGLTKAHVEQYFGTSVAFIPGLVGVLVTEPYATRARRNSLATQGRYAEIFRSSLRQLKEKDERLLHTINEWLSDLFDVEVSAVSFDEQADEYVTVKYRQIGIEYDVVCSGAGLQQIIQMLTYLYLVKPQVLLIDEPDAHLHSRLQARLGDLFRRVAADLNAQVFLSTHSVDLIDTFSTAEVLVVDSTKKSIQSIGHNADLVSTLVDANIVDVSALSRLLASRKLVVIEDKDQTVLKAIDKAIGSPLFSVKSTAYVLPAKGVGNFRAIAELGNVLKNLTGTRFEVSFVQDRDGMPDFIVEDFTTSQTADGVSPILLERHEIESYLIEPALFEMAAAATDEPIPAREAKAAIVEAARNLKAEARRMARETAKNINRHLSGKSRRSEADVERETDQWFDQLDCSDLTILQVVFPGKELLNDALSHLNGSRTKPLTRGNLVAAIDHTVIDPSLLALVKQLGKLKAETHSQEAAEKVKVTKKTRVSTKSASRKTKGR